MCIPKARVLPCHPFSQQSPRGSRGTRRAGGESGACGQLQSSSSSSPAWRAAGTACRWPPGFTRSAEGISGAAAEWLLVRWVTSP